MDKKIPFRDREIAKHVRLIEQTDLFQGTPGNKVFYKRPRPYVLQHGLSNLYPTIQTDVLAYFKQNSISWWRGQGPTGHVLSSQIACLNHLFPLRQEKNILLQMVQKVLPEIIELLPLSIDVEGTVGYIAFEVHGQKDWLNEHSRTRGANATSIDAMMYAQHKNGQRYLIPIEWKYTEVYSNLDKSKEDRRGRKGLQEKGKERLSRYQPLIRHSKYLVTQTPLQGSIYFQEPFYQLMRQTLLVEQMILHSKQEILQATNFHHLHVVPSKNHKLLHKTFRVTKHTMVESWKSTLSYPEMYTVLSPENFLAPIQATHPNLYKYLEKRYWS